MSLIVTEAAKKESAPGLWLPQGADSSAHSVDTRLSEQQDYYRYGDSGFTYKAPPPLPDDVARAMEREGLNGKYRFIWLGVAVVREIVGHEKFGPPVIRGDERACEIGFRNIEGVMTPWLQPKKLYVRTRQPVDFVYEAGPGLTGRTKRPDMIPEGVGIVGARMQVVEFGALEWRIEQKLTGEQAVKASVFRKTDDVPADVWRSVKTIRSADGLYAAPSVLHVEALVKREWENRNLSQKELTRLTVEETEARAALVTEQEAKQSAVERKEYDAFVDSIWEHEERAPHSTS